MNFEDALISRTAVSLNRDEVAITEVWDTAHPSCPFVAASGEPPNPYWRAILMRQREFAELQIPLK